MKSKIVKANTMIALFMGAKYYPRTKWYNVWSKWSGAYVFPSHPGIGFADRHLKYNESWDWLMPVIEKISSLNLPDPDGSSEDWQPFPRTFGMIDDETGEYMFRFNRHALFRSKTLFGAAYLAVVDFLKSYNTN